MTVDEWDYRALCPDGGCTGVIGPNGQCKVCGRAAQNWGDERKRGMRNPTDPLPVVAAATDEPNELAPTTPAKMGTVLSAWNSRVLCTDGGCIGVVGADGKCNVCGKAGAIVAKDADEEHDEEDDVEETGAGADEAQAEDDEGDDDDDDDEDSDDDDDESDDDDDDEEPDDEEDSDSIHASASPSAALEAGANGASLESDAASLEPPPERALCPDGACVGVIGADGLCKVCGKAKDAETSA